jgi:apolipoprotein N-acyltransferase
LLTGFSWLNLGYSQIDAPLRGFAPLVGAYGVTLAVALSAGLLALLVVSGRRARVAALAGLGVLWLSGALLTRIDWTEASGAPLRVSLMQGNIPQDSKWSPELVQHTLDLYARLTRQHWDSRLILWPEAAITAFYHEPVTIYPGSRAKRARMAPTSCSASRYASRGRAVISTACSP